MFCTCTSKLDSYIAVLFWLDLLIASVIYVCMLMYVTFHLRFFSYCNYNWIKMLCSFLASFAPYLSVYVEVVREKRQFKVMHTIEQKSDEDCMCPHLYNVARRCYREMMGQRQASVPLSILLTGRSGSGKTRRLKSLLHFYCATVCSRKRFLNCE